MSGLTEYKNSCCNVSTQQEIGEKVGVTEKLIRTCKQNKKHSRSAIRILRTRALLLVRTLTISSKKILTTTKKHVGITELNI